VGVFVETERALEVDEAPYSCTATIPDDGIAKVSAKNPALLEGALGVEKVEVGAAVVLVGGEIHAA